MKNRTKETVQDEREEIIATFGEARIVRSEGRVHLRGGSMAERTEALEWLAMFMPEVVANVHR